MKTIKLKRIAQIITGFPFKGHLYSNKGIRTVRGENVTEGKLRWDAIKCWNQLFEKEQDYLLKPDDIVIGMDGSKVGKNKARIRKNDLPLLLAQRVACVRSTGENNQIFLYYLINNPRFEEYVFRTQTGSSVPHISKTQIEDFEVPIIDFINQKKIAKVLSDLDAKIELNNKINTELEAMAKTLYDYWFVQFDFPYSPPSEGCPQDGVVKEQPYKSSGGKMVYNEELKRAIPEGWEVKDLGDLINIFDSKRIPLSRTQREKRIGEIPYYGATSIMGYVDDHIFDDEYILLAEDGSVMDEKGFPIVQFIWGKTWVNNHAHVMQAKEKENNEYIFHLVKTISVIQIMTGSIQMKINQENLRSVKVVCPDEKTLKRFSNFAMPIRRNLINKIQENQELASLRDWLLPMLMNGQVSVGAVAKDYEMKEEVLGRVAEGNVEYKKG